LQDWAVWEICWPRHTQYLAVGKEVSQEAKPAGGIRIEGRAAKQALDKLPELRLVTKRIEKTSREPGRVVRSLEDVDVTEEFASGLGLVDGKGSTEVSAMAKF
jgi:hypothetical protein